MKNKKAFRISESKLRRMVKEGVHDALNETSYDFARKAYEKGIKASREPNTFKPISGKVERAERLYNHLKDRAPQNVNMNVNYH